MAQLLTPTSDQATGSWTNTPLWSKANSDDGTDAISEAVGNNTQTSVADLKLTSGSDPQAGTQTLRARWHHDQGGRSLQATCELYQGDPAAGGSLIATLQSAADVGTTEVEDSTTVTGITDYTDLYVRLYGFGNSGGPGRSLHVDLVELSIPDASGGAEPVSVQLVPASATLSAQALQPSQPSAGIRGTSTGFVSDASTQYSVTTPAETVENDLLVLFQHHGNGALDTEAEWGEVGSDWTLREAVGPGDNESVAVWTKSATATDADGGGSYAFESASADSLRWDMVAVSGGAYDAHVTVADTDVTTSPSVSGTIDPVATSTVLLAFLGKDEDSASSPTNTWSSVQGMTAEAAHSNEGDVLFTSLFSEELVDGSQVTRDFNLSGVSGTCKLVLVTATFSEGASPVSVELASASMSVQSQTLGLSLGATTTELAPATSSLTPQALGVSASPLSVELTPATASLAPQALDLSLGALTVELAAATATLTAQALEPQVSGSPVTVQLVPATFTANAQSFDLSLGATSIALAPAGLSLDPQALDLSVGVSVALVPASISVTPQALGVTTQPLSVALVSADLVLAAQVLGVSIVGEEPSVVVRVVQVNYQGIW